MKDKILNFLNQRGQMPRYELYNKCVSTDEDYKEFRTAIKELNDKKVIESYNNVNLCYRII